ncbi:hypothetical protein [Bradyrhizobium sp. CCBAU 11357]|uniref:hypothetical protein n=1 Tax=Bradyrhizobium sp. CCBAU 11357 TaxID=1630808 RepID=UPI002302B0FE|nr:hypothetical protein [Bradyrhizobium sp. CCBAU 11357]
MKVKDFNSRFETDAARDNALNWLIKLKLIETDSSSGKPKYQFEWSDGKRRRSYTFSLPAEA